VIYSVQIKLRPPSKGRLYVASIAKVESRYFVSFAVTQDVTDRKKE